MVTASEFQSEDPGFDPLVWQCEGQFVCPSESTFVQTCLCLAPDQAPFVCTARTDIGAYVKDPISILSYKKESRPQPVVWKHEHTANRTKTN